MSIWATWLAFGAYEDHGQTYTYEASHVMPTQEHRGGSPFQIAAIPAEVEAQRDGTDDEASVDMVLPWLRLSLGIDDAVIDADQVRALHEALGVWLDRQKTERNQP